MMTRTMPKKRWGSSVPPADRRDQFKLIYDYIKFHIGLYLATPAALALIADGLNLKRNPVFVAALLAALLLFLLAGINAALFMSRHVNDPWQDDYLVNFELEAFSMRRRFLHHGLYWIGLLIGIAGLLTAWVADYKCPSSTAALCTWMQQHVQPLKPAG
ncbi:hypothetical protein [Azohydromonas aeria]|uniref:hypothetical protein n=1 Tax=Azohydromonas aeria TaxID=2590212 RepID=UPI0012F970A0|nr:hypothetical protein [Azohydromonas aeria]